MFLQFAPTFILLLTVLALLILHWVKPSFTYNWLIAVLSALIVWIFLLASRQQWISNNISFAYTSQTSFFTSLSFRFDEQAWMFSLALAVLLFSNLLTSLGIQMGQPGANKSWSDYASPICLTAFCLLICSANNLITFFVVWIFIDAVEIVMWSQVSVATSERKSLTAHFGLIAASYIVLIGAAATGMAVGGSTDFSNLPAKTLPWIVAACSMRLGVLPPIPSAARRLSIPAIHQPMLFLTSAAPVALLLLRITSASIPNPGASWLMFFSVVAAMSAGFSWLSQPNQPAISAFWVQGTGALLVASALYGQPGAAQAWGLAMLLIGGIVLEYHLPQAVFRPAIWLGAISLTSLPFVLTWAGAQLYSTPSFFGIVLIFGQSLLAASCFRYSFHTIRKTSHSERWILPLYGLGLIILIGTSLYLSLSSFPETNNLLTNLLNSIDLFISGLIIFTFSGIILFLVWLKPRTVISGSAYVSRLLDFSWLYPVLSFFVAIANGGMRLVGVLLEGGAGIIWTILMLVLLITLLQQTGAGGL